VIGNLQEQFLYERLPDAIISGDERGYIEAVVSGYQDRLEDVRSFAKKLDNFWVPGALPDATNNVVLVDLTSQAGKTYTRSLDLQDDTPAADSDRLPKWVATQLALPESDLSNIRYGHDPLRSVDVNTLSWLAATLGTLLYQTDLMNGTAGVNEAQVQLVNTWFPRLKIKGTAQSFEVLGRILGFDDVRVTPLWSRLSPRVPDDVGDPANDPDFAYAPEYFPRQVIGPFYDPFVYRDGPFFSWSGTASNGTNSTQFYTETITGHNPWVNVVLLGSLAGTNVPAISGGVVTHPANGSYVLANGASYSKAYVDCPGSSIRFQAIAEGDDFNGLFVHVETSGTLAVITVEDRLSAIKYRSSYFDLGLTADMDKLEDIFGSRAATTNADLKADPTLTSDGTAVSPYRPWVDGSIAVAQTTTDWVTVDGTITTVAVARREANPADPYRDRQLNFDSVVAAGVQVTQAFEEVRAATRLPRRSQAGFLQSDDVPYAVYECTGTLFTTDGSLSYNGTATNNPLAPYTVAEAVLVGVDAWILTWPSVPGRTYSPFVTFVNYEIIPTAIIPPTPGYPYVESPVITATGSTSSVTVISGVIPAGFSVFQLTPVFSGVAGLTLGFTTTDSPLNLESDPSDPDLIRFKSVIVDGSYRTDTHEYWALFSAVGVGADMVVTWLPTSTEVIRDEPDFSVKDDDNVCSQARAEDDDNGLLYEVADDYPWRREIVVGGELVELDSYQSGSEIAIQVVEEATAFNDQTGVDINVYGITSDNTPHVRTVWEHRSTTAAAYHPGYLAVAYKGEFKNLSTLTSDETDLVRPPIGSSVGDTETDYDVLFEPGYGLYHCGLAQGVLVADLPKFFGQHHSAGLVGWFACNEHVDDNLTVADHSNKASVTVLSGVSYTNRQWDDVRGWVLHLDNAQIAADKYRDVVDETSAAFWIRLTALPTVETRVVDNSPVYFTVNPSGSLVSYAMETSGTAATVGAAPINDGAWHFVYIRRNATNATFGAGTLGASATEVSTAGTYPEADPDVDTALYVQAYGSVAYDLHDLRLWNVYKSQAEMDLVRYHAPNPTLCTYRLGFIFSLDREDKYGIRVLDSGWAVPDVLPAWYRRTRQGLVLRYDSMGSYIGETRFKEVGIGNQRPLPDTYTLGQQFVTMTAEGTAPFSTDHGQLPGWNAFWQASNYGGNYDVLSGGSTASGSVVVSTASGTASPWPNTMTQTNPFRQYVYVNAIQDNRVYQLALEGNQTSTWLEATPVAHGRTTAEVNADPYLAELLANGTIYTAAGTGFIQGTLAGSSGTYGFYDPATLTYYPKTFNTLDLYVSDIPTGAYVLLSGSGSGVLLAHTGTHRGVAGQYTGTNTTPPLFMYTNSRFTAQVTNAYTTWTDAGAATPVTNDVDVSAQPGIVTVTSGTYLNTPALGKAGVLEFNNSGTLVPGPYVLTVISGQIGQADTDFSGFAVDINVNDTVIQRRLLHGLSGYNFRGTDSFQFDLNDGVVGDYLLSFDWTNPAEDPSKGTKRQLAIYSYSLRHITTELFKVTVSPAMQVQITPLYTDNFSAGTTPGGWFTTINSYGTRIGYKHEADIYTANDTVTSIYPLGDTLTGLTNDRRNDVIYTGTNVVVADTGSFTFPTFGTVIGTPV